MIEQVSLIYSTLRYSHLADEENSYLQYLYPVPDLRTVWEREENRSTRRKPLGARTRTNNKLNSHTYIHMTPGQGVEPGRHRWEASALITAPSLLPFLVAVVISTQHEKLFSCSRH